MKTPNYTAFRYSLIVTLVFLIQGCFWGGTKPDPDPKGTLGAGLQPYFNELSDLCSVSSFNSLPNDFNNVRSIVVEEIPDTNLTRLFSFLFSDKDILSFKKEQFTTVRYLDKYKNVFAPDIDATNLLFASNCIKRLKDIAKVDGDVKFGAASIEGAFNTQTDMNKRRDLVVIGGIFSSPLSLAMASGNHAQKTNQFFRLLAAYENNGLDLDKDSYSYLDTIKGYLVTWTSHMISGTTSDVNLNVSSNIAAEISNELSLGLSKNLDLKFTKFHFFYDKESVSFAKLPSLEEVIKHLENTAIYKDVEDEDLRFATRGGVQQHMQVVPGMPKNLCESRSLWNVSNDDKNDGSITLEEVKYIKPKNTNEEGECQFLLQYRDSSSTNPPIINKSYTIDYKNSIKKVENKLKLKATASIPFLNEPRLVTTNDAISTDSAGKFKIQFRTVSRKLSFELDETTEGSGALDCGGTEKLNIQLETSKDSSGFWYLNGQVPHTVAAGSSCSLQGTMVLNGKVSGRERSYPRQINASITKAN